MTEIFIMTKKKRKKEKVQKKVLSCLLISILFYYLLTVSLFKLNPATPFLDRISSG